MNKVSNVWVFSDIESRFSEVMSAAASLGERVNALVIGSEQEITNAQEQGAHRVFHMGDHQTDRLIEDYAETMASVMQGQTGLLLLPNTRCGKALAAILGVKLNAGMISEAQNIEVTDSGNIRGTHLVYGGLAEGQQQINSPLAIVVIASGAYAPAKMETPKGSEAVSVSFVTPSHKMIRCTERRPREESRVDLNKAKRIVGIGRGIAKQEDIELAEQLATVLDAELGCSRPIAESEKWMEQARYIGISGVTPKPEFYLTLGISGQVQHMVGANGAQLILAVNKDKNAPIFQYADYGIVGDLYKVIPALIEAFK